MTGEVYALRCEAEAPTKWPAVKSLAQLEIDRQYVGVLRYVARLRANQWHSAERLAEYDRLDQRHYRLTRRIEQRIRRMKVR
jgi:hypothetical protein